MKYFLICILAIFSIDNAFSQGLSGGMQDRKENIYFDTTQFEKKESHFDYGIKSPLLKKGGWSSGVSVNTKSTDLANDEIKNKYGKDNFFTSGISFKVIKKRESREYLPWMGSLGYSLSGSEFLENGRSNVSFRLMTGHFSKKGTMHNYGVALSSSGAFKGIPFPFYVFTKKVWNQNLTIGFPFIGLSGPRSNETNYNFSLSPGGISLKVFHKVNKKGTLFTKWSYKVDDYFIETEKLTEDESLLVEKHSVSVGGSYKFLKKLSMNLSLGREFEKKYFKGENIFKKDDTKFNMSSSSFIKSGIGYSF